MLGVDAMREVLRGNSSRVLTREVVRQLQDRSWSERHALQLVR